MEKQTTGAVINQQEVTYRCLQWGTPTKNFSVHDVCSIESHVSWLFSDVLMRPPAVGCCHRRERHILVLLHACRHRRCRCPCLRHVHLQLHAPRIREAVLVVLPSIFERT